MANELPDEKRLENLGNREKRHLPSLDETRAVSGKDLQAVLGKNSQKFETFSKSPKDLTMIQSGGSRRDKVFAYDEKHGLKSDQDFMNQAEQWRPDDSQYFVYNLFEEFWFQSAKKFQRLFRKLKATHPRHPSPVAGHHLRTRILRILLSRLDSPNSCPQWL